METCETPRKAPRKALQTDLHKILTIPDLDTVLLRHLTILDAARFSGTCSKAHALVRRLFISF